MRALLDANVLYPTILREILIDVAAAGLYQPLWSPRILEEWRHAATRLGPDGAAIAGAEIAGLRRDWPRAETDEAGTGADGLDLPDPADRHVVQAAMNGGADLIVTANLRDFPRSAMRAVGLQAVHPDSFLIDLWLTGPEAVTGAADAALARARRAGGDLDLGQMLKRSRLPRLRRALMRG